MVNVDTQLAQIDAVFENGWIYTGDEPSPQRGAIAVSGGRIVSTDADEVARLAEHADQRIDLAGRLLLPGFQDAHLHPVLAGVEMLGCDLSACENAADTVEAVRAYAQANPDVDWIVGAGWSMDAFPGGTPTRQLLDAVVPDRPVMVENRDHHGAWVNTRALELAGIDALTQDPADGRFEREADGFPSGTVHEGAMSLFEHVKPQTTPDQAYAGLLAAQEHLFSFGITAWQDAALGCFMGSPDTLPVYERALAEGTLKARVRGAQWWNRDAGEGQLAGVLERRDRVAAAFDADQFSAGSVKVMVDGVAENFTAAMHAPYLDPHGHDSDNRGISFFDPAEMTEFVTALDANGMQVHFHALGDRAVTDSLNAIEHACQVNGALDNRHHLAHLQVVRSEDTARFAPIGATANMQALWAAHENQLDELTLPFLPADAAERHYPFGDIAATGAHLAAGSDWSVSSPNPIEAIHVAVNRKQPGSTRPVLGSDRQKLSVKQIVDAYTQGTARVNHLDHATGRLAVGFYADLAIVDRNIFALPADELHEAQVDETWVAGERVFVCDAD